LTRFRLSEMRIDEKTDDRCTEQQVGVLKYPTTDIEVNFYLKPFICLHPLYSSIY